MGTSKVTARARVRGRSRKAETVGMKGMPWKNPLKGDGGTRFAQASVGMKGMGLMVGFRLKF